MTLNGKMKWIALVVFFGSLPAMAMISVRSSFLNYGPVGAVYLDRDIASPGDKIKICFDKTSWTRLCRAEFISWITCFQRVKDAEGKENIRQKDFSLPTWNINTPKNTGPIDPKCRLVGEIPDVCVAGPMEFKAFARGHCWPTEDSWPIIVNIPSTLRLMVR